MGLTGTWSNDGTRKIRDSIRRLRRARSSRILRIAGKNTEIIMKREDNLTTFGKVDQSLVTGTDNLCIKGVIGIYNCKQALVKNPGPDVLFYCSVIIMAPRKK